MFYDALQEKFRGTEADVKRRLDVYKPFIKPLKNIFPEASALDLGCGRGEWLDLCQEMGFKTKGVEISPTATAVLRARGVDVAEVDAIRFLSDSHGETYALITAFHLVEHIPFPDVIKLLEECLRCLKPGGLLILETPNPQNIVTGTSNFYLDPTHKNPIPPQLLAFSADHVGFSRVKDFGLQEPSYIHDLKELSIYNIIADTSPDYAVVAQKSGTNVCEELDAAFSLDLGVTISQLALRYDQYLRQKHESLQLKIKILDKNDQEISENLETKVQILDKNDQEISQNLETKFRILERQNQEIREHLETKVRILDKNDQEISENLETKVQILEKQNQEIREHLETQVRILESENYAIKVLLREKTTSELIESRAQHLNRKILSLSQYSQEIENNYNNLKTKFIELGTWSTDVARRHGEAIAENNAKIIELEKLLSQPSLMHRKALELYWTITRLLGLGYLHDGSNTKTEVENQDEIKITTADFERIDTETIDEAKGVSLAYCRLQSIRPSLLGKKSATKKNHKKSRVAFISPFPPLQTGVADYNVELLVCLGQYYDIDAIQTFGEERPVSLIGARGVFDIKYFEENACLYDHIIYHLGNSRYHAFIFPLLKKYPGVIALHDVYLLDALRYIEHELKVAGYVNSNLYISHGYGALGSKLLLDQSPSENGSHLASFDFIQASQGVILHSNYALNLIEKYFGGAAKSKSIVIPLSRKLPEKTDKKLAREALGLPADGIIVCSFGFLGESKLNHLLLAAWQQTTLNSKEDCHLIFVGGLSDTPYCNGLQASLETETPQNIKITGFVDPEVYRQYLCAADIAVQLRANSQGETSGSTLDCMAYGLVTIVTDYSSFSELPDDGVIKIPYNFTEEDLASIINNIAKKPQKYTNIVATAEAYIKDRLNPSLIAKTYRNAIQSFHDSADPLFNPRSLKQTAISLMNEDAAPQIWIAKARSIAEDSCLPLNGRRLFIDISAMVRVDMWTGIQRVVRAQVIGLLKNPPEGFRVEPVYLEEAGETWRHKFARVYTCGLLGISQDGLADEIVTYAPGDIYYMPDFYNTGVTNAVNKGLYQTMHAHGVEINFLIHDILPITMPEMFPEGTAAIHEDWLKAIAMSAHQLICISHAVKDDTNKYLGSQSGPFNKNLSMSVLHHGADINASLPSQAAAPDNWDLILASLADRSTFLMVSTIEPRKGYLLALEAFEKLWRDGADINLVIVGKEGWKDLSSDKRGAISTIVKKIKNHPQLGRRLFWQENLSDAHLQILYQKSTCLLAASENEGYGLPLIEAAQYKLPILARDIPVFREVLSDFATYFDDASIDGLVASIIKWLEHYQRGAHIKSSGLTMQTWAENIETLKKLLIKRTDNPTASLPQKNRRLRKTKQRGHNNQNLLQ